MAIYIRHAVTEAGNQRCEHEDRDTEERGKGAAPSTPACASTLVAAVAHWRSLHDPPMSATLACPVRQLLGDKGEKPPLQIKLSSKATAADIAAVQAPELVRWKRSFVYRCCWPDEWPRLGGFLP